MGRKSDPVAKAKNAIAENTQVYQRMNFLHQAAILLANIPKEATTAELAAKDHSTHPKSAVNSSRIDTTQEPALSPLSRHYCNTMKQISRKLVLRLDPNVKRSICKTCENILIPSVTSSTRVKSRPQKNITITCRSCNTKKRLVSKRGHELWTNKSKDKQVER
ncbi:hypothetical protein INT43_003996 [Umbelopsis isabellina]|uniref:Uncharacterized protein n=1 Tax=Mortierella isabellina TaxID=91625 RepID=A0A8H7PTS9_MORIS|nr:hypothetical protein INT43_003996 [Umbelopsis isabellina]